MEGSRRDRYGKILKKAEKYLHRRQGSESSATSEPSVAPPIKGASDDDGGSSYKAYLRKAKEFMQKKDDKENQVDDKENQVGDGNSDASAGDQDKKKQYAAIATGLLMARKTHKLMRKGQNKNGKEGQEGEEEEVEEEEEEEDEEVEDEESSGWFTEFIEGMSEFLGELEL